jgi:hypothetical protein
VTWRARACAKASQSRWSAFSTTNSLIGSKWHSMRGNFNPQPLEAPLRRGFLVLQIVPLVPIGRIRAHSVPTVVGSSVKGVQQAAVLVLRVAHQMAICRVDQCARSCPSDATT